MPPSVYCQGSPASKSGETGKAQEDHDGCNRPRGCIRARNSISRCRSAGGSRATDASGTAWRAATAIAAVVAVLGSVPQGALAKPGVVFLPHQALYELSLLRTRNNASVSTVRGRILYDFSGNACDGFVLQFRQVSELDNGEGKVAVSDLRASTWEEGGAKAFRFNSQNYVNDRPGDMVDGKAERRDDKRVGYEVDVAEAIGRYEMLQRVAREVFAPVKRPSARAHLSKNSRMSVTRSRTTGRFFSGAMSSRPSAATASTWVRQVQRGSSFTVIAQDPHMPTRHANR